MGVGGKSSPSSLRGHSQPLQKPPTTLSGSLLALLGSSHPKDPAQAAPCNCNQAFRNKTTNSQDTFFCVNKDLDLPTTAAIPGSGAWGRLWTSPKPIPRGFKEKRQPHSTDLPVHLHGQDRAYQKHLSGKKHRGGNNITTALSILLPGCRTAKETEECGSREEMGMLFRDLEPQVQLLPAESPWQHHRNHAQVTVYTPRSSRQRAPRSCRTLPAADSQPQLAAGTSPEQTLEAAPAQARVCMQRGHCRPRCPPGGKAASW